MATKTISISLPDWLIEDLELNRGGNRSDRVQELLIKGYMVEQKRLLTRENALSQILSRLRILSFHIHKKLARILV